MPPAEAPSVRLTASSPTWSLIAGWGAGDGARYRRSAPTASRRLRTAVESAAQSAAWVGAPPRGMGRSYGDAAQVAGGLVIETTRLKRIELEAERGTVTAQAGATVGELLREVVPAGWIVPVVPGSLRLIFAVLRHLPRPIYRRLSP